MRRWILVCSIIIFQGVIFSSLSSAEENGMKEVFKDGLYGGLAGALVGGAVLAFTKDPGDHLNYIAYGAAGGVLAGTIYGIASVSRAFAEIEGGKLYVNLPLPKSEFIRIGTDKFEMIYSMNILRLNF